jgi:hypothetical protein
MGWRVVVAVMGAAVCCVACRPASAVTEPVRTTTATVAALVSTGSAATRDGTTAPATPAAPDGFPAPAVAWADVCGPVDLPSRPLTDADVVVDLVACGATDTPVPWQDAERAEAEAALRIPGLPAASFAGITCAGPRAPEVYFAALIGTGQIIGIDTPAVSGPCPVVAPAVAALVDRLTERDRG